MSPHRGLTSLLLAAVAIGSGAAQTGAAQTARALAHYDLAAAAAWQERLPRDLAEISGLAFGPDGRLFAHGDERGIVWRYDLEHRRPAGRFGIGDEGRVIYADFEDITVVGERLFLVTGTGAIYEGRIAPDGQIGRAARRIQGLGRACEVEGMTWDPDTKALLLLCKTTYTKLWKDHVVILAVSPDTWRFERRPRILVPHDRVERVTGEKRFSGSGLTRHPRTETLLLIAGPQRAFVEVGLKGEVLGGGRLDKDRHPQPEGIAIAPDLTLLISDEAAKGSAAITAYAYRP
jgi:uncharacterized protein YjiK